MALSISTNRTYSFSTKTHPTLGKNYVENGGDSITASYFKKMGLQPSYYMPKTMAAPLAFYHQKNDLITKNEIQLYAIISVMDTIQRIYRPEIYCCNNTAGDLFKPSLNETDYTPPPIFYDRDERDNYLIKKQAEYVLSNFLLPYKTELDKLLQEYRMKIIE